MEPSQEYIYSVFTGCVCFIYSKNPFCFGFLVFQLQDLTRILNMNNALGGVTSGDGDGDCDRRGEF